MTLLLSQIADLLGLSLRGEDCQICGVNSLEDANANEITFLANPKYVSQLATTKAAAVIVSEAFADKVKTALISAHPYQDFGRALALFAKPQGSFTGQSTQAFIHDEAHVAPDATIYPFVYIGARARIGSNVTLFPGVYVGEDCEIGADSLCYPNACLMAGTILGTGCILYAGAILGADGFGYVRVANSIQKIPQIGTVTLGDNVEVGANSAIDRAVMDITRIGSGTKIDNLVQIGHNVQIGDNTFVVALAGIAGSTKIGSQCTIAAQVGIAGHLTIGDNVTLAPRAGVMRNIPDDRVMGGSPAVDQRTFMRTLSCMPDLPKLFKRVAALEKALSDSPEA